ncbi:hypothetical protein ACF1BN_11540 [Streptomyces sp. NPDC014861]|uniref:hypothetical protein n=1 Tax=Streptomyces sp. NPDC014861 TaxID=3364923 RepID=UPI0036FD9BFA
MSASDRSSLAADSPVTDEPDEAEDTAGAAAGSGGADGADKVAETGQAPETAEPAGAGQPAAAGRPDETDGPDADVADVADTGRGDDDDEDDEQDDDELDDEAPVDGMTPKQARRLRVAAASVLLVVMGVILVVRLASRTSVLVVGVYGLAMILCGIVIELARNGRTRLATWLLVGGLAAALAFDWLILP